MKKPPSLKSLQKKFDKIFAKFPEHIANKKRIGIARKKFLEETFGEFVKEVRKIMK